MLTLRYCAFADMLSRFLPAYAELPLLLLQIPFSFSITLKRCINVFKFAGNVAVELDALYKPYSPVVNTFGESTAMLLITLFIACGVLTLPTCNKSS